MPASKEPRSNEARDSRSDDVRDVRTEARDRDDNRGDYRRDDRGQVQLPEPVRERSYLTRAPRQLPVYFGAEFEPQVEGVALVSRVDQGSPADRAGLRRDDIVTSLNGRKVTSADDALSILVSMRAGDRAEMEYTRQARGRAVLADSRDGALASRSADDRVDIDRTYDATWRADYKSRYDSRDDNSRDRSRPERRGLGIFRRR
jgi:predicted metalloprotease with PDZ domain